MTSIRVAAVAGLLCCLAVAVWASGGLLLTEREGGSAPLVLARGLEGLWIAQLLATAVLVPWHYIHGGLRDALMAQLVFLSVPLPLLTIAFLADAAELATFGMGLAVLLGETLLVLGAAALVGRLLVSRLARTIGIATVQAASISVTLALLDRRLGWTGL